MMLDFGNWKWVGVASLREAVTEREIRSDSWKPVDDHEDGKLIKNRHNSLKNTTDGAAGQMSFILQKSLRGYDSYDNTGLSEQLEKYLISFIKRVYDNTYK